jgi:hypothetical protein
LGMASLVTVQSQQKGFASFSPQSNATELPKPEQVVL